MYFLCFRLKIFNWRHFRPWFWNLWPYIIVDIDFHIHVHDTDNISLLKEKTMLIWGSSHRAMYVSIGFRCVKLAQFGLSNTIARCRHRRISWQKIWQITLTLTIQKIIKARISQISRFLDFESGLRETEKSKKSYKGVISSGYYFSIMNWSLNNIIYNILFLFTLAKSALKA